MSGLRGHRGARGVGAAACLLLALGYLYRLGAQRHQEVLRCDADRQALHAQLKAIVDYKERMEHSLSAEKNHHADSIASLQHQLKEQNKLTLQVESLQNRFDNATKQYNKMKESLSIEKQQLNYCQNNITKTASEKNKYEEKILELNSLIEKLRSENSHLHRRMQLMNNVHSPNTAPRIHVRPPNTENKNISQQIKISKDTYHVPIFSSNKANAKSNIKNMEKHPTIHRLEDKIKLLQLNTTENTENVENKFQLKKPEIPQGVAPELPVDENMNEKNMNLQLKPPNDILNDRVFNERKPDGNSPNRYKVKLSLDEDSHLSNGNNDDGNLLNFGNKPIKKSADDQPVHIDNRVNDKVDEREELVGGADVKIEDVKKDDPEDSNISQNNGEPNNNNEIREDDDDMDEYGYGHRLEAAEDPINK